MMRFAALALGLLISAHCSAEETPTSCATVTAGITTERQAGHLTEAVRLFGQAAGSQSGCAPRVVFCLGRSLAFAHLESAYAAMKVGHLADATRLLQSGQLYGEPWPLLVGLGDAVSAEARRTHDPKLWSEASVDYQKAVSTLDEPALCDDEPPAPEKAAADAIIGKMSVAMLLAQPLILFHSKCAPCALAVLSHGPITAAAPRALPVTFKGLSPDLTAEGAMTAAALADCGRAEKWNAIAISVHSDPRGSAEANLDLSRRRIEMLRQALRQHGFDGTVTAEPKGKSEPIAIDDPAELTPAERERANRRIELRTVEAPTLKSCTPSQVPVP